MTLTELVIDMKRIEKRLLVFEEKYGLLSRDFYTAMLNGELTEFDAIDEIRFDFLRWLGAYKLWIHRETEYCRLLTERPVPYYVRSRVKSTLPVYA